MEWHTEQAKFQVQHESLTELWLAFKWKCLYHTQTLQVFTLQFQSLLLLPEELVCLIPYLVKSAPQNLRLHRFWKKCDNICVSVQQQHRSVSIRWMDSHFPLESERPDNPRLQLPHILVWTKHLLQTSQWRFCLFLSLKKNPEDWTFQERVRGGCHSPALFFKIIG